MVNIAGERGSFKLSNSTPSGSGSSGCYLPFAGAFIFVHLFATSILALRTKFLPKWNALLGFVPAALFLVSTLGAYDDTDLPMITGGIGFITWSIWILATSFNMWKTAD